MTELYLTLKGYLIKTPCLNVIEETTAMSAALRLGVIGLCVAVVSCAIHCTEDYCSTVDCEVAAGNNAPPCRPDQRLNEEGTWCGCCSTCVTQLSNITTNTLTA